MGFALKELAEGETDIPRWLQRGRLILEQGDTGALLPEANASNVASLAFLNNIRFLVSLRVDQDIRPTLEHMEQRLSVRIDGNQIHVNREAYLSARKRYEERFADRAYFMENLMVSLLFHLGFPGVKSAEGLWKSCVNFCILYAIYRIMAIMSCREGASATGTSCSA